MRFSNSVLVALTMVVSMTLSSDCSTVFAFTPPLPSKAKLVSSSPTQLYYTEDDTKHPGESIVFRQNKNKEEQEQKHPQPRRTPLEDLNEGEEITGRVKAIYPYGVFIDIGARSDGLLHKSNISTKFVSDPNDWFTVGDTVHTKIKSIDLQRYKIEFTMLDIGDHNVQDEDMAIPTNDSHFMDDNEPLPSTTMTTTKKPKKQQHEIGERTLSADHVDKVRQQLLQKDWNPDTFAQGTVTNVVQYGAFVRFDASDINSEITCPAEIDGMVHISSLSPDHIEKVTDVVHVGDKVPIRLTDIRNKKLILSMVAAEDEKPYYQPYIEEDDKRCVDKYDIDNVVITRSSPKVSSTKKTTKKTPSFKKRRQDDRVVRENLVEMGWDTDKFVKGKVVGVVDFGAFVKVDATQLQSKVEGELFGLVHISVLTNGHVNQVKDVVKVADDVQVRVKGIDGKRVSLSMVPADEERPSPGGRFDRSVEEDCGAKDWKESLNKIQSSLPSFKNTPLIVEEHEQDDTQG